MNKNWVKYIQTARRFLGLSDEEYIAILLGAAGVDSSTQIQTEQQFRAVRSAFQKLGFTNSPLQGYVLDRAKKTLGKDWKKRLNGYCQNRFGKSSVYQLEHKELRAILGFLNALGDK